MIQRAIERFGADYGQWRALTRVSFKLDVRTTRGGVRSSRSSTPTTPTGQILFYLLIGVMLAALMAITPDIFLAATFIISYVMFMVGVMVLLEYHTVVTAPDDYYILGFQPISSRTYFAARITNLLAFVLAASSAIGLPSAVVIMFKAHFGPAVLAGMMLGVWGAACTTALGMVLLYGWLVQRVPANRLARALSYLQLTVSFVLYGGYMLLPQVFQRVGAGSFTLPKTLPVLLYPATWFASYVEITRAHFGAREIIPALAAVLLLVLVARAAAGKISLEFAERLAGMSVAGGSRKSGARASAAPPGFRRGEARAVWILLRSQFRNDQKFRMSVLAILPMTLLYMLMAVGKGGVSDPFVHTAATGNGNAGLLYMAVIMFPILLNTTITRSDNFKAAWVFYATAADREAVVIAMKNAVFVLFLLPYLLFTGAIFLIWFRSIPHTLIHVLLLGLLSHLGLLILMLFDPQLPFSKPFVKGERSARLFVLTALTAIFSSIAIPLTIRFIYISAARTTALILGLGLVSILLETAGRWRMKREILASEFVG